MSINEISKCDLEKMIRQIIMEKMGQGGTCTSEPIDFVKKVDVSGIASVSLPTVRVSEANRLDTGTPSDVVYTKDVFTLAESPRLGCGIMEMKNTTFDWTLNYDEIDYIIEGHLDVIIDGRTISASAGELILIPKGSKIKFSVPNSARFIYITYPADWASQG